MVHQERGHRGEYYSLRGRGNFVTFGGDGFWKTADFESFGIVLYNSSFNYFFDDRSVKFFSIRDEW